VSYYYLAAQLPSLAYGQPCPLSPAAFCALAAGAIPAADAALLGRCTLDPAAPPAGGAAGGKAASSGSEFLDGWAAWERALRLNLARLRQQRTKREEGGAAGAGTAGAGTALEAPPYPADAAQAAKAACAMESPLEAEIFLDKARWNAIDTLAGFNYFSRNTIYAYLLKLLLMERRQKFSVEEGQSEYKRIYAAIRS
jgi:hypothetical protein